MQEKTICVNQRDLRESYKKGQTRWSAPTSIYSLPLGAERNRSSACEDCRFIGTNESFREGSALVICGQNFLDKACPASAFPLLVILSVSEESRICLLRSFTEVQDDLAMCYRADTMVCPYKQIFPSLGEG